MRVLTRLPFTLLFLTVMVAANALAGTFAGVLPSDALADWGISHSAIRNGELFRLATGSFLSHDLGMFVRQFVFAAIVIGAYEWSQGSWRAVAMYCAIDVTGSVLVLFGVLPVLVWLPVPISEAALNMQDVGMSAGGFGLIGALVALQRRSWAILAAISAAILIKAWFSFDLIADTAHLLCLGIGFVVQRIVSARQIDRTVAQP